MRLPSRPSREAMVPNESSAKKRRWPWVVGAVVVLLAVAAWVAVQRLDAVLTGRAREAAQGLSQKLGRPVELGSVETRLVPYLGVSVAGARVGAGEGESVPLAELPKLEVRVAWGPALKSLGKDVRVLDAEALGLTLAVERLPDGTTNVSRLMDRLAAEAQAEPQPPPGEEAPARDLSFVHVARAAITDARVRLVDRSVAGQPARELAVNDLDVEVKDLEAGRPLVVTLAAAVLAPRQNLKASLTARPLPVTLVPTPEKLALEAKDVDLAPLGPFLGPELGLQAGRLEADWKADLGSAVPGGSGPTRLAGALKALGLRFAGAEGGRALDVVLDTDVTADLLRGDLALSRLLLSAGPARLEGTGQASGLLTGAPRVEGLKVVGHGLDPAELARYYPPLKKQLPMEMAGPIGLSLTASGTAERPVLALALDFTPVRLAYPGELTKAAGAPMRLAADLTGGAEGALAFDAKLDLSGADLRPGELLNKAPGQPFVLDAGGRVRSGPPMVVDVTRLTLRALEDTMTGTARYQKGGQRGVTHQFALDVKAARLDADKLLWEEPEPAGPPSGGGGSAPAAPAEVKDPHRFDGLRGDVKFAVGSLRYSGFDLSNVNGAVKLTDDRMEVQRLRTGLLGGELVADGTELRLGPAQRPFTAKLEAKGLDVARALVGRTPRPVLGGLFSGKADLTGAGFGLEQLSQALVGRVEGALNDGNFLGTDVVAAVTGPLVKALPFAGKALSDERVTALGDTLPFGLTIEKGVARLKRPITLTRPDARLELDGGVKLDGTLALAGTVALSPALVQKLTAGRASLSEPVPVALQLSGPAWSPSVGGLDLEPALKVIGAAAAATAAERLVGDRLGGRGKDVVQAVTDPNKARAAAEAEAAKKRAELEARAAEERQKAEAAAREEAERARKRAEDEAKKRLKGLFGR